MSIQCRQACVADTHQILSMLDKLANHEGASQAPRLTEDALLRDVFSESPRAYIFVAAAQESRLLGFILVYETYSSWKGGTALHVGDLWVEQDSRGRNLGRNLMTCVLERFPGRRVDAYVVRTNQARGFYKRLGFAEQTSWCLYRKEPS